MTEVGSLAGRLVAHDLVRQLAHWRAAARSFRDAEEFASAEAWKAVERSVAAPIRQRLHGVVEELLALGDEAERLVAAAHRDPAALRPASLAVERFRQRYIQVDTTLDFLGDAVNSRTSPRLRAALGTLDELAAASIRSVLQAAKKPVPQVLVYQDKGTGASILRAGVRLWAPGAVMPVAAIKIVRHNLFRPTSLFHETGHQVAHLTGWTASVEAALRRALADDTRLMKMWAPWASEITADVFAFLHTGYASVAALYDVVGDPRTILSWPEGDPHPIGWLRTALGCEFSRQCFGAKGPWNALQGAMQQRHSLANVDATLRSLVVRSLAALPRIARACLDAPVPALSDKPMRCVLDPARVSPTALAKLERDAGPALFTSSHFRRNEGIRIVALTGLREAENPETAGIWIDRARTWMTERARAA